VKEYYQVLVATLLGTFVEPWKRRQERQVIGKAPKFYLFDVGVAGALTWRRIAEERGELFGRALEHFFLMEIQAHRAYRDLGYEVHFWRTKVRPRPTPSCSRPPEASFWSSQKEEPMDARVKRFREGVARYGVGGVGRRYPEEWRAVAVAVAEDRREEPLSRVAADLGISTVSLQRWLEQGEPVRFRPVEVEAGPSQVPVTTTRGLALITPRGYRVEGLEAGELVSLLRVLE
jgi:hypothetical protein